MALKNVLQLVLCNKINQYYVSRMVEAEKTMQL